MISRACVLLALFRLLTFAMSASAECAWVLWLQEGAAPLRAMYI
jgi:hypothetical protein